MDKHLASIASLLARAAFRRVFETVTLYWNHNGGRYRELDRAEIEPQHPFALTENARTLVSDQPGETPVVDVGT